MLHCLYVCGVRRRRRESSLPNKIGTTPGPKPRPVEERFWEKVGPHDDPTKCWLTDYHVVIPEGMTIDHVKARGCTSTLCVNPHHLEMVSIKRTPMCILLVVEGVVFVLGNNTTQRRRCYHARKLRCSNKYT